MRELLDYLIRNKHWFLFLLLEIVSFTLLFRFNSYQGSVYFTSASQAVGSIYNTADDIKGYFALRQTNDRLTEKNITLELQLSALERELKSMKTDTSYIRQLSHGILRDYSIHPARVINNSVTLADNYITINRGSSDGIHPEMGVIDGSGVVGIVYLTSPGYSVVIPLLNTKSNISCKIKNSDYFGFLKWTGESPLYAYVRDMPRHSVFSLGDTIVTSGHSTIFPEGIMVGTIEDTGDSHDGLSYMLKVRLASDFSRLSDVRVISNKDADEIRSLEQRAGTN